VKWGKSAYDKHVLGPRRAFLAVMTFSVILPSAFLLSQVTTS
jgi:hypothetical protein